MDSTTNNSGGQLQQKQPLSKSNPPLEFPNSKEFRLDNPRYPYNNQGISQ